MSVLPSDQPGAGSTAVPTTTAVPVVQVHSTTPTVGSATTQRIASIFRQVFAVAAVVVGYLMSSGVINAKNGGVLMGVGGAILAIEHYLSDPGTTVVP